MVIRLKARSGESAEQILRRFKKLCEKEGLTKEIKRRAYYEKPSEKKQRALRKSLKRVQQIQEGGVASLRAKPKPKTQQRGGSGGGGGGGGRR